MNTPFLPKSAQTFTILFMALLLSLFMGCEELIDLAPTDTPPPGIPIIDSIMEEEIRIQELGGVAVGVVRNGVVEHVKGYGYLDLEARTPVTANSMIRWASISKPLTAVAAMKLVEAGHLDLDKNVRDYVSHWPSKSEGTITMRQLLGNTAGVGHYPDAGFSYDEGEYNSNQPYNAKKSLDVFKDEDLVQKPGSDYHYSTFGYMLAAAVVDAISRSKYNKSYPDFVRDSIAVPLGISSLQPDYSDFMSITPRTKGYYKDCDGIMRKEGTDDVSWKLGGGGWISTPLGLTKFMKALMYDEILQPSTLTTMTTEQVTDSGSTGYGLGFDLGGGLIGHGGWQQNGRTYMYYFTGRDLGITIMCNSEHVSRWRIFSRIAKALGVGYSIGDYNLYNTLDCDDTDGCKDASERLFAGVWRAGTTDQIIRRGYTTTQFNYEWTRLSGQGYRLHDLETYEDDNGDRLWDGVFKPGNERHALWRNFNTADFNAKWTEMSNDGLRLIDLETYEGSNGDRLWAGVFIEGSGAYAMYRNYNTSDFNAKWTELAGQGLRLIDLETYTHNGTRLWAGVWRAGTYGYAMFRNYNTSDFNAKWQEMAAQNLRLVDLEAYESATGTRLWAGVWKQGTDSYRLNRNYRYCGWLEKHRDYNSKGLELVDLESYE